MAANDTSAAFEFSAYRAALASYRRLIVMHIANALELGEEREHRNAVQFAKHLDEAGLNVDAAVDAELNQHHDMPAEMAWKAPRVRRAEYSDAEPPF